MGSEQKTETKYGFEWVLTVTRAPENINTDYIDGQKIILSKSDVWFESKDEAIAAASLTSVPDIDYPDSWGLELVITQAITKQ